MTGLDDHELLHEFARVNSEAAFAALVARHVNLVYSVALRQTGNPHDAEEITQAVFIILARKTASLGPKTILSGWLYQTARLTAANYRRTEFRRAHREQEAFMQSQRDEPQSDISDVWPQIAPLLDDALGKLGEHDRHAIVLRFFENKTLGEVGAAMGASEDAARMRVNRALEKLRKIFSHRGVTLTAALIAGAVSANSVQAAPVGLAVTVAATAAKGAVVGSSTLTLVKGALKLMAWTKAKVVAVASLVVLASAAAIFLLVPKAGTEAPSNVVSRTTRLRHEAVDLEQLHQETPVTNYVLADIDTMPGFISSHATDVNNQGRVVGWMDGSNGVVHAFVWDQGSTTDLGTFGGSKAIATGINDQGEIVGVVMTNGQRRVFVLQASNVTDLGTIDGFAKLGTEGNISYNPGVTINDLSQVTGRLMVKDDSQRSFLFSRGLMSYFGLRGDGNICYAKAMNNRGQIAGQSIQRDNRWGVFLWQDGEIIDLKTLDGPRASASAINDHGIVVGWAIPTNGSLDQTHAIVWEKGKILDLNLAGWKTSRADGINNAGEVVGSATTMENRSFAFLKRGGEILNLNDLVGTNSGWHLFSAGEINDRGQILAQGIKGKQRRAFLVSPSNLSPLSVAEPVFTSVRIPSSPAAASRFNLTSFERLPSGAFRLAFAGSSEAEYLVEASTNLITWEVLGRTANRNGEVEFTDADAAQFSLRFYRVATP